MPLLVDSRNMTVLGGNMRYEAMLAVGWTEAVCSIVNPKNDREAVQMALEDNDQFGQYIIDEVIELAEEFKIDTDINISMKPFSISELIINQNETNNDEVDDTEIDIDKVESDLNTECPRCNFKFKK